VEGTVARGLKASTADLESPWPLWYFSASGRIGYEFPLSSARARLTVIIQEASNPRSRRRSMNGPTQDLKDVLLHTDDEFHQLAARHHQLEDRLHELSAKHYLSQPEQLEEVNLKKKKLQLKDRMEDILRRHRTI
jgi:uncharacterized protein YdcH (DUF465 family)